MSAINSPTGELLSGFPSESASPRSRAGQLHPSRRDSSTNAVSGVASRLQSVRAALVAGLADSNAERVDWVDAAKGICVLLMVYGHVIGGLAARQLVDYSSVSSQLNTWKYQFNMPGLFVLCGLFLHSACRRSIGTFVSRRASALLYPAVLFGVLTVGAINIRALLLPSVHAPAPMHWLTFIDPMGGMWTLSTLFWVSLVFAVLIKSGLRPWHVAAIAATAFLAVGASGQDEGGLLAGRASHLLKYLALLSVGAALAPVLLNAARRAPIGVLLSACLGGLGVSFASYIALGVESSWAAAAAAAPGILGMFSLAVLVTRVGATKWLSSLLQVLGRNSMQIFVLHSIAHAGTRFVLYRLLGIDDAWVLFSTSMLVGLVVPLAVVWAVNTFRVGYVFRFGPHERTLARAFRRGVAPKAVPSLARAAA